MKKKKIISVIILILISTTIMEPVMVYSYEKNMEYKDIAKVSKNSWIEEEMDNNEAFIRAIEEATNKKRSEITKKDLEKIVKLTGSGASEIPRKIDDIVNLVELDFAGGKIESVPESIRNLKKLKKINLNQNNLQEFPNAVLDLPNLRDLHINKGNIKEIPVEIEKLKNTLVRFDIRFQNLVEIPNVLLEADNWIAASKETHGKGLILDITDNQISQPYNNEVNIPFSMGGNLLGESKYEKPSYGIKQDQLIYIGDEIEVPIGTDVRNIEIDTKNLGLSSGKDLFKGHTFEVGVDGKSDYNSLFVDGIAKVKGKTNIFIKTTQSSADNMKARAVVPVEVVSYSKPIINGVNNLNIIEGNEFDPMYGVTAEDAEDGDLTKDIKVSGEVNTKKPGSYEIIYEVTDSDGNKTTVKRRVKVIQKLVQINNAPIIYAKYKVLKLGDKFNEMDGVTAFDREDGDITKNIKVIENTVDTSKAGKYKIVYEVSDSKGVKTIKEVSIVIKDNDYINNNKLPKTGYSSLMVLLGTITTGLGIVFLSKKK
ncbi:immunoglobulin-like domain-containing protein [Clostridium chrysemydis]|uniref:immunoglobulin-like domain-containing protein n=1 Tax=Clostridium chrysemydis TaxID=2665504 RepID=UPI0018847162|nr:immunoglobulin-like domain-containing protein [Clostridium chrysemydis]